jgi:copper transport protein
VGVALCLLGSIVGARDVSGHAVPVSSDPAPNATLSEAPHEVVIRFSERVDARASRLEVLDGHGQRVDHGDATVPPSDPWRYRVGIHGVADGVYTVAWRVLSADDGHVTDGAHVFAVGTASAPGAPARVTPQSPGVRPLARWMTVVGCALLLGVPVVRWRLGHGSGGGSFARVRWLASGMVVSGGAGDLVLQARELAGGRPLTPVLATLLTTASGHVWLGRVFLLVLLAALAAVSAKRSESRARRLLFLALASVVVMSGGLVSHSAGAVDGRAFAVGAQAFHLLAMAVWVGGLLGFVQLFRAGAATPLTETQRAGLAIPAFSQLAIPAVGVLGASGLILARVHVTEWTALLTTPYGRWLTAKLLVFAVMLVLAGYHQLAVSRRLRAAIGHHRGDAATVARFGRTLRTESALGVAALLLAAVLGVTPPPAPAAADIPVGFRHERTVDEANVRLDVTPLRPGPNAIRLTVATRDGHPLADATAALVQFVPATGGVGPATFSLTRTAPGTFEMADAVLGIVGRWDGRVVVQREGAYDVNDRFELILPDAASTARPEHTHGRAGPLNRLTAWSLAGISLGTAVLWARAWRTRRDTLRLVAHADQAEPIHTEGGSP